MSAIAACLSQVRLGIPQVHLNLTIFPLLAEGPAEPGYRLLDDALSAECARVTEVSELGSVPELRFVNDCDRPVLLLDGEERIGAKQNRILNLTVLAPAGKSIVIPVSCVEAGRWRAESTEFASAERAHFAAGRARKTAQVSESLRRTGTRFSDQAAVWGDIAEKAFRMDALSDTDAAAALYQKHRPALEAFRGAFHPVADQVGALFAINGRVAGVDLFDSSATLAGLLPKLVESYALDAIDATGASTPDATADAGAKFLDAVAGAGQERFAAVGIGEDVRLTGEGLAGGALLDGQRVVHLCAFAVDTDVDGAGGRRGGLARASLRGNRFIRH